MRSVKSAQPFSRPCVAATPGFITSAAADFARHLVGNAGRKPVANVPANAQELQFISIPLALADDLFSWKDPNQHERQHATQVLMLKLSHGCGKSRRLQKSGNNFTATAL